VTPEEKYNQEVWWILQEIKKEQLYCPEDERDKVGFSIRTQPEKADGEILSADVQRKILNQLKEWGAIDLRQNLIEILSETIEQVNNTDNEPSTSNITFNSKLPELPKTPTKYVLMIHQPKFDEIYENYQLLNRPLKTSATEEERKIVTAPENWRLDEDKRPQIKRNDVVVFTFANN